MSPLASTTIFALGGLVVWALGRPVVTDPAALHPGASQDYGQETKDATTAGEDRALDALTFVRGVEVPVASAKKLGPDGRPRTIMVDAYLDWDFGTLTYFGEDGSMAAMPAPKNWEFRHAQLPQAGGGMVALCFQPGTGLSFLLDGEGKWGPIAEPSDELVVGDYDVTLAIDVERVFGIRFDHFSGRSWTLEENGWLPIGGNLQGWPEEGGEEADNR